MQMTTTTSVAVQWSRRGGADRRRLHALPRRRPRPRWRVSATTLALSSQKFESAVRPPWRPCSGTPSLAEHPACNWLMVVNGEQGLRCTGHSPGDGDGPRPKSSRLSTRARRGRVAFTERAISENKTSGAPIATVTRTRRSSAATAVWRPASLLPPPASDAGTPMRCVILVPPGDGADLARGLSDCDPAHPEPAARQGRRPRRPSCGCVFGVSGRALLRGAPRLDPGAARFVAGGLCACCRRNHGGVAAGTIVGPASTRCRRHDDGPSPRWR